MANSPPLSVIICAYNAEKYLENTINSVLQQTYANIEILILDDASTDSTSKIIEKASDLDSRIRYIRNSENKGIAHVRQQGLENAKYDWISFVDADDLASPNMIEKQVQMLIKNPDLIAVGTYAYYISEDDKVIGIQKIGPKSRKEFSHLCENAKLIFMSNTSLYSRQHATKIGGYRINGLFKDESVRLQDFCEDLDLWCRLSDFGAEGKYMITIQEPLFYYRKRAESLSAPNVVWMQRKMRWIKDCLLRRRAHLPERSYDEYYASLTLLTQLNNQRLDYAAILFRKAGFAFIKRRYLIFLLLLFLVSVLNPKYLVDKVRTQKFMRR